MSALVVPGKRGASAEEAERATHRTACSGVATHSLSWRLWGMLGPDPRFPTSQHTPSQWPQHLSVIGMADWGWGW